ncbi:sensor histidine kinase [Chitinimonas arctica]|uniref:Sensor histidine kinase n=2 Tax=Chitinimonas arctica TaxID=2594795 RepID=A0A516SM98_9NEIS|nr:sensor histidine kinase [Chitinimonas arctica]
MIPDKLPDTRNLGVLLRSIVSVNLLAFLFAISASDSFASGVQRFVENAALLEPSLLLVLAVLASLRNVLANLSYSQGVAASVVLAVFTSLLVRKGVADLYPANVFAYIRAGGSALCLSFGLFGYFRLRGRALSPLLAEARLQALQARIRPHFLFNSLNAVLSLIRSQPRKAEQALEDLADLFRVFMAENRDLVPLAREVSLAGQYLGIEGLRLGERLQMEWHTERMPADAMVPPLILQPLLENAVLHGIEPSITPGIISINIFCTRDELHIDIRNPYFREGGDHHAGNKMAMGNIRERLRLHFDAEANLKTMVGTDYYQVHLTLPYRPAKDARHDHNTPTLPRR